MDNYESVKQVVDKANRSEVHRRTGISLSGVSRILNGKRNAKSDNLSKIAEALNLKMDDLHAWLTYIKMKRKRRGKVQAA